MDYGMQIIRPPNQQNSHKGTPSGGWINRSSPSIHSTAQLYCIQVEAFYTHRCLSLFPYPFLSLPYPVCPLSLSFFSFWYFYVSIPDATRIITLRGDKQTKSQTLSLPSLFLPRIHFLLIVIPIKCQPRNNFKAHLNEQAFTKKLQMDGLSTNPLRDKQFSPLFLVLIHLNPQTVHFTPKLSTFNFTDYEGSSKCFEEAVINKDLIFLLCLSISVKEDYCFPLFVLNIA